MPDFLTFTRTGAEAARDAGDPQRPRHLPRAVRDEVRRAGPTAAAVRLIQSRSGERAVRDARHHRHGRGGDRLAAPRGPRGADAVVMNSPDERVFGPQRAPVPPTWSATRSEARSTTAGSPPRFGVEASDRGGRTRSTDSRPPVCAARLRRRARNANGLAPRSAASLPRAASTWPPSPVPFEPHPRRARAAHIGVVPTLRDPFTELLLPVKLLEYVHMGLPAVASAACRCIEPLLRPISGTCGVFAPGLRPSRSPRD